MHFYTAYGLNIHSEIDLFTLPQGSSFPDVYVRRGKVNPPVESNDRTTWTTKGEVYFRFQGVGAFQISGGRSIVVDADGVDDCTAGLFVLGPAMGLILHQRGALVLHASAVKVGDGVVAFLGHSGSGKSTMAAAMVNRGASAFCDDLVAVQMNISVPTALPGYPYLKLALDSGEMLGFENRDILPTWPNDDRRRVAVSGADPSVSVRLARVYVLEEGEQVRVEALKPQEAAAQLIRHSYAGSCIRRSGMAEFHLKSCAKLVECLPIRSIRRPRRLELIHEVAERVWDDVSAGQE